MSDDNLSYFGLLADAPVLPGAEQIAAIGWAPDQTLVYTEDRETFDVPLSVLARLHRWEPDDAPVWIVTTAGLSVVDQTLEDDPPSSFRRVEFALACNNITQKGPIPEAFAEALQGDEDAIDWDAELETPPLMEWLFYTAQNLASMVARDAAAFGMGTYLRAVGNPTPASRLLNAVVLPACPQLLAAGLEPWCGGEPQFVHDWWDEPGFDTCERGFFWLLPIDEDELDVVEQEGPAGLLGHMTEQADGDKRADLFELAFDLMR